MNLIIMSYNYYPDISPASYRIKSLVENFITNNQGSKININVLCSEPSRYNMNYYYDDKKNKLNNVKIFRSRNYNFTKTKFDQLISFINYICLCFFVLAKTNNKIVIVTSSKLGTALICYLFSFLFKYQYIVDLRDILSDNMESILKNYSILFSLIVKKIILFFEKKILYKSLHVNVVSDEFKQYYLNILNVNHWTCHKNGIDNIFLKKSFVNNIKNEKINILYVGNNGAGQALDKFLPQAAKNLENNYEFTIIGSGSHHKKLINNIQNMNIKNIKIIGAIERNKVLEFYKNADILLLHLNNINSFKRVLPSKIFEYIAVSKPIIAGLPKGFASEFIKKNINHCVFFESCNSTDFIEKLRLIDDLKINADEVNQFKKQYSRDNIMQNMTKDIMSKINSINGI
jgi:UDP-N-acetylglucosamine:LPS N-acetylglucosamine transferase